MDKVNKTSMAINDERLKQLQALFPEAFAEGKVDFDKLRQTLGENVDSRPERYSFTWAGKREAMQAAQIPSRATLIPDIEQSVNFDETQNIFIEGDNLEVLKLLARPYFGRVKMIYIDPPYNTGNDFVYPDNYADPLYTYLRMTGQKNGNGDLLTTNAETNGRYHSAWLSMMYPRLQLARQLLHDDGILFISIDYHEIYHLRMILNELFGEENFVGELIWKRRQNVDSRTKTGLSLDHEYAVIYRKNGEGRIRGAEKDLTKYSNPDDDPRGPWASDNLVGLATKDQRPNLHYDLVDPETGISYPCTEAGWRYSRQTMARLIEDNRIIFPASPTGRPRYKRYLNELMDEFTGLSSVLETTFSSQGTRELKEIFDGSDVLDFPKPVDYIKLLIEQGTTSDGQDIIFDFFAGSATTAQAVMELNREDAGNRRFILVQLPEKTSREDFTTISAISRERIRRVIQKMQSEENGKLDGFEQHPSEDLGFRAFRLAETSYRPDPNPEGLSEEEYSKQMALWADSLLVDNWDAMNVIYEVALKEGYGLNIRVEEASVEGNTVYRVSDPDKEQSFSICLDDTLRPDIIDALGLKKDDLFICHDNVLDDTLAANLALQVRLQTL